MPPEQSHPPDDDRALIEVVKSGRTERFEDLVVKYGPSLYNFGVRMCGHPQDAEDLVQDTFLNIYTYLNDFRFETHFKNWMFRIAARVCLKQRRHSTFAPQKTLSLEQFLPKEGEDPPTRTPDWASLPIQDVLDREMTGRVQQAILDLPKKYRLVLVLRDIEGFSTEETGKILAITPANVKVRLHRARLFIRDKLKGYYGHGY
jgi:RNA polymerase sigma-70 factor (ECF subfamily)